MATLTKGKTFTNGETVTPQKLHELVDLGTISGIVNADIAAGAAIADSKLAQITTAGKVLPAAVQGTAVVTADPRLSDTRVPVPHTHAISDTTGLQTALDGKQAAGSYAAASHTHDDRYYTETEMNTLLAGKQASGSYAPASHGHAISDTTGLQTALDGKQASGSYAAASHTHAISDTTGLQTALDGKQAAGSYAAASHTHDDRYYTETEMNTLLAGKQAAGSYAPATGIAQSAVTNLTTDLAGKAASSHTHDASEITTGTLGNARTTAAFTNTPGAIVLRDGGGGFRAGQIISSNTIEAQNLKAISDITIYPDGTGSKFFVAKPGNITVYKDDTTVDSSILTLGCTFASDSGTNFINFNRNYSFIGSITQSGTSSIAYNTSSDYRLKTNIEPLTAAVSRLLQIPVHRFNWLADPAAPKVDGFLAHEAQAIVPESVTGHKDEVDAEGKPIHQGIDQSKLVPLLVAAVQELAARVAALEAR